MRKGEGEGEREGEERKRKGGRKEIPEEMLYKGTLILHLSKLQLLAMRM